MKTPCKMNPDAPKVKPKPEPPKRSPHHPQSILAEIFGCAADMAGEGWRIMRGGLMAAGIVASAFGLAVVMKDDTKPNAKEDREP